MTRTGCVLSLAACLMAAGAPGAETADSAAKAGNQQDKPLRNMLVINEDNSHFFGSRKPEEMTLAGLNAFVDQYAGSAVTHLFLCPNAMRASFRSGSRDAIWDPVGGKEPEGLWPQNAKRLFEAIGNRRAALLCGEEDPTDCHRRRLIGRVLGERGVGVLHIRGDGRVQTEEEVTREERFRKTKGQLTLFDLEEAEPWRSTRSVSPRRPRPNSSGASNGPESSG